MARPEDPFVAVERKVLDRLRGLPNDAESLRDIVTVLASTIPMVEQNRHRFPHIDDAELARRKAFVRYTQAQLPTAAEDQAVDSLQAALERLGAAAVTINTELVQQDPLLQELHDSMDEAHDRLAVSQSKVDRLLQLPPRRWLCCGASLLVVAVLLVVLIVFV